MKNDKGRWQHPIARSRNGAKGKIKPPPKEKVLIPPQWSKKGKEEDYPADLILSQKGK